MVVAFVRMEKNKGKYVYSKHGEWGRGRGGIGEEEGRKREGEILRKIETRSLLLAPSHHFMCVHFGGPAGTCHLARPPLDLHSAQWR